MIFLGDDGWSEACENFGGWNFGFKKNRKKWRNTSWISMILNEDSRLKSRLESDKNNTRIHIP